MKTRDGFVDGRDDDQAAGLQSVDAAIPVYQFTYAGPGAPQVRNAWGGADYMFHQLLAQQRHRRLDSATTGARAARAPKSQWPVYGRLGERELQDIEDGVAWLKQQPYVDASRIVLSGWSYGGFMTRLRADAQHELSAGIAGGTGDRLARLRLGLHRAADEAAEEQPGRLPRAPRRASPPPSLHGAACC